MTIINGFQIDSVMAVFTRSSAQFKQCHFRDHTKAAVIVRDRARRRSTVDFGSDCCVLDGILDVLRPRDDNF
jgi:hypothetical protein